MRARLRDGGKLVFAVAAWCRRGRPDFAVLPGLDVECDGHGGVCHVAASKHPEASFCGSASKRLLLLPYPVVDVGGVLAACLDAAVALRCVAVLPLELGRLLSFFVRQALSSLVSEAALLLKLHRTSSARSIAETRDVELRWGHHKCEQENSEGTILRT